jgi:hypothetical protein
MRWSDLGLGIDEKWTILAFVPCPQQKEAVTLSNAIPLRLPGDRWRKVLTLLAGSADGRTAQISDLMTELGYRRKFGPTISKDQAEYEEHLSSPGKRAQVTLRNTMADLARELRDQVATDDDRSAFEKISERAYQAAFVAGYLMKDENRRIRFSWGPSS